MLDGRGDLPCRWEYVDRSRVKFHHLWTANPDGTGQMVYFGNMHPGTAMLDENGNSVKRMHSFLTVMPGETTGCSGRHENRTQTTINARTRLNQAVRRPPSPTGLLPASPRSSTSPATSSQSSTSAPHALPQPAAARTAESSSPAIMGRSTRTPITRSPPCPTSPTAAIGWKRTCRPDRSAPRPAP